MKLALRMKAAVSAVSSLFGATRAGTTTPVSGGWGWLREPFAGAWQRGISADPVGELTAFGAVFACISRISTDIAKLRIMLMALQESGIWQEVQTASPFWPVLRKPNAYQNRIQFLMAWIISKLIYGNTYVLKVRDNRGIVIAMHVLDPRRVTPLVTMEGDVYYQLGRDDLAQTGDSLTVPAREIIHDRGVTLFHPLIGVPPIYACGIAATQGRRIQGNSAKFFENMSRPSGMLTAPGVISQATADRLKEHWEKNYSGDNIGRMAVLGDGLKYEAMTIPPEQAQMVEQLGWTVEDVARCFGVPLYKINAGTIPPGNSVEALGQQYYSDCLQIYIEAVELCLDEGLALPSSIGVELDLDGLLRMDTRALSEALAIQTGAGVTKINEARRRLNQPPTAGGDACYLQQQNYSLEALAKRDAQADPFATGAAPAALPAPSQEAAPADQTDKALLRLFRKAPEELIHA